MKSAIRNSQFKIPTIQLDLIKLVSWDVDGTLYSIGRMKWRLLILFLLEVARGRGLAAYRELAVLRRYRARIDTARLAGGVLDAARGEDADRAKRLNAERRWYGQAITQTGPRAGLTDLLSFFAARNIPQVAFSDYGAPYKLDALGLKNRFARIYEGEHLGFVKPNPRVFELIAVDFAVPRANVLHIGDRVDRDDVAARAAGCHCLILGRDFRSFPWLLHRLRSARRAPT